MHKWDANQIMLNNFNYSSGLIDWGALIGDGCCTTSIAYNDQIVTNRNNHINDALSNVLGYTSKSIEDYDFYKEKASDTQDKFNKSENLKGENEMSMFDSKLFGKIQNGMCRLSMQGGIAVKTSSGYKTYNLKSGRLVNCSNFVFDIGEEFFFVIPTNKVERGDIILVNGKPKCVMEAGDNTITVINYEDSVVETILPERHVFMGNTYFYGKIVSMFGNDILKGDKGMKKMMSYMLMSEMMKGNKDSGNAMSSMLPFMMLGGGNFGDIFGDLFDEDPEDPLNEEEAINEK